MAADVKEPPAPVAPPLLEAPPSSGGGGGGGMVKIIGVVLTVMVLQGTATYFLLPAPPSTGEDDLEETVDTGGVEVPIDKFNSTNSVATGHKIHVSVEVVAIVAADQHVSFDEAANKELKARVRQTILKVISGANIAELNEAGWNTMRRRMREEVNKLLRKSYVIEIVFPSYQTTEQ